MSRFTEPYEDPHRRMVEDEHRSYDLDPESALEEGCQANNTEGARCCESSYDLCFYCEDWFCEAHLHLLPGHRMLRGCAQCLAERAERAARSPAKEAA